MCVCVCVNSRLPQKKRSAAKYLRLYGPSFYFIEVDIFKPSLTLILDDLSTHYTMEQIAIVKFIILNCKFTNVMQFECSLTKVVMSLIIYPRFLTETNKYLAKTQPWWLGGRALASYEAWLCFGGFESRLSMVYRSFSSRNTMLQFPMQNAGSLRGFTTHALDISC